MTSDGLALALRGTAAPLLYLVGVVAFFLALKSAVKIRRLARTAPWLAIGLGLTLAAALCERPGGGGLAVVALAGLGLGAALGLLLPAVASRLALLPALGGAAAAALAADALVAGRSAPAFGLAAALGTIALVLGGVVAARGSTSVSATAAAAFAGVLAGWATALVGLGLGNVGLLVAGGVAGTAALALGRQVARAGGRSLAAALLRGRALDEHGYANVRSCGSDEAAMVLEGAGRVLVVPGFGMPAAQAQHAIKEVGAVLEKRGVSVAYLVHPDAGCLPGHINIALDEANVAHDKLVDLAGARSLVAQAAAVLVVGANDTINAAAAADPKSPLFGLDALDLGAARAVLVIKRSLRPGAGGVRNPLFERPNTTMMFGDGKRVLQAVLAELKGAQGH